ncbi:hypothetical protein RND71_041786 [Anisodus tanguticus]|uniref:Aminotransferase-like plant mobile domain-containing protein n=1 Tax=Anisodus tanguticus TaxID=243964 RepID=A0AAE1QW31_9SOLA|nr:hypothetical protein RND71_041786 [Anisodus tanguticus]
MAIRRRLGCLVSLFNIFPDQHLVRALIHFWDPDRVVFRFGDFEMTPTLEEISYFTDLIYQGRGQIIPHCQSGKKFLRYLGLKNTKKLLCFENNWVSMDYLYERYGCRDSYKIFKNEFSCTPDHWRTKRPIAFTVAFLGSLIFPLEYGKISTCICSVARGLFEGVNGAQLTLAPMILAEMFRALGKCKRGETGFFEGCNLIADVGNGTFLPAPEYGRHMLQRVEQNRQLLRQDEAAGGTPEYQAWLREDCSSTDHSPDGEQGFEDIGTTIWVRNFRLRDTVVTLEMWHQMQNIVQYLEDAGAGPSGVRVSSSSP